LIENTDVHLPDAQCQQTAVKDFLMIKQRQ